MEAVILVVGALAGIVLGFPRRNAIPAQTVTTVLAQAEHQARALLDDARRQAETNRREAAVEARDEALRLRQGVEAESSKLRAEVEIETRTRLAEVHQRGAHGGPGGRASTPRRRCSTGGIPCVGSRGGAGDDLVRA